MDMNEILRKMSTALNEEKECNSTNEGEMCPVHGMAECSMEESEENLNETVLVTLNGKEDNITLDGDDADRFVSRLMQLSGQGSLAAAPEAPAPTAAVAIAPAAGAALPAVIEPTMADMGSMDDMGDLGDMPEVPAMSDMGEMGDEPMDEPMADMGDEMDVAPMGDIEPEDDMMSDLAEDIHIDVDGEEADELLARLLQLSGQGGMAAPVMHDVDSDIEAAHDMDADMDMDHDMDMPAMPASASNYVCDDCGESPCMCGSDGMCPECGAEEGTCECDMSTSVSGPLVGAMENADFDHGHGDVDGEGEVVDPDTYMYKAPTPPQRMVKGVMGDNPMMKEAAMATYKSIVNKYVAFLGESETPNEDGQASPLTSADRQEFDKDPSAGEKPVTDGSMSPMSKIKRQDVMK